MPTECAIHFVHHCKGTMLAGYGCMHSDCCLSTSAAGRSDCRLALGMGWDFAYISPGSHVESSDECDDNNKCELNALSNMSARNPESRVGSTFLARAVGTIVYLIAQALFKWVRIFAKWSLVLNCERFVEHDEALEGGKEKKRSEKTSVQPASNRNEFCQGHFVIFVILTHHPTKILNTFRPND